MMHVFQPRATPRFHQAALANSAVWTLTDPLNIVNTLKDKQGYTEIVTNATAGLFYFTRPLVDAHGAPIDAATEAFTSYLTASLTGSTGAVTGDELFVGTSDNADPTAGGALFDVAGYYWWTVGTLKAGVRNETTSSVSTNVTADRTLYQQTIIYGETENAATVGGYNGNTGPKIVTRGQASLPRAYVPTHLCVVMKNNTAAIKTLHAAVGAHVHAPLREIEVTARS